MSILTFCATGFMAVGIALIVLSIAQGRARRRMTDFTDDGEFTHSMRRFGYVRDARNRGDL